VEASVPASTRSMIQNEVLGRTNSPTFVSYYTDDTENTTPNNSHTSTRIFVAAVTFLLSRCLAAIRDMYIDTRTAWRGYEVRH
jgi:hypothetical protein